MLGLCWPMLSGAARLGRLEAVLGPSWAQVGPTLAYVGSMLALCWPMLALSWPMLALSWPYVGPTLAYVGPMLAHLGAYVEAMLAICETISVERLPRCKFFIIFPSRTPPPQNQKPRKNNVFFLLSPTKKFGSAEATKHSEKQCFCDPTHTHTKHRKLQVVWSTRGEPGVGRQRGRQRL